jgi:pyruvate,water dikinase
VQSWNYHQRSKAQLAELERAAAEFQKRSIRDLTEKELAGRINELSDLNTRIAYYNIILPLLMSLFNAILQRGLEAAGVDFTRFDVTSGLDKLNNYDPNTFLDEMKSAINKLPGALQGELTNLDFDQLTSDPRYRETAAQAKQFIKRFGHLSESGNDFSSRPWREDPNIILKMVIEHHIKDRGQEKVTWESADLKPFARWRLKPFYLRARKLRLLREQVSSIYTSSYGWFRMLFNALAAHLIARGVLAQTDDIYYLTWSEIQDYIDPTQELPDPAAIIQQRRNEIESSQDLILPDTIYGDAPPPLTTRVTDAKKFNGIPTSPGYYQGRLKVIRSITEFDTVEPGDVIAIPYSDVAWTPLFAKAGAVIAEAGGILSHSSIVAREYGIPCVVSVSGAINLPQDCIIYVDGYQGEVNILDGSPNQPGSNYSS